MMRWTAHIVMNAVVVQARLGTHISIPITILAVKSSLQAHGSWWIDVVVIVEAQRDGTYGVSSGGVGDPGAVHDGGERLGRRRLRFPGGWIA